MAVSQYYAINNSLYANGFQLSWASNTTLTVTPGICRDSTNTTDIAVGNYLASNATNTTVSNAFRGINGLDAGTVANNTWYAVHAIDDSSQRNPGGFLLSTSATAPLMPYGYDSFRRIGWTLTNSSAQFILFYQYGNAGVRSYQWDARISVLSSGTQTTFTAVSLSAAVPPVATRVDFAPTYTPALVANTASIRPTGSSVAAANAPQIIKNAAAAAATLSNFRLGVLLSSGNPSIDYVVTSSDSLSLAVVGFDDNI